MTLMEKQDSLLDGVRVSHASHPTVVRHIDTGIPRCQADFDVVHNMASVQESSATAKEYRRAHVKVEQNCEDVRVMVFHGQVWGTVQYRVFSKKGLPTLPTPSMTLPDISRLNPTHTIIISNACPDKNIIAIPQREKLSRGSSLSALSIKWVMRSGDAASAAMLYVMEAV